LLGRGHDRLALALSLYLFARHTRLGFKQAQLQIAQLLARLAVLIDQRLPSSRRRSVEPVQPCRVRSQVGAAQSLEFMDIRHRCG
jgi:hypothetical protein